MIKEKRLSPDILGKISPLVDTLQKCADVIALFFFGSLATGKLRPLSDLDMAIFLNNHMSRDKIFKRELELIGIISEKLGTDEFDLIILNTAPWRFAHQIFKSGKKIFVQDQKKLADFHEEVVKKYIDFKYYQKQFDQAFLKNLLGHG